MRIRPLLVTIFTAASVISSVTFGTTALSQGLDAAVDQSKRELLIGHEAMHNERVATIDKGEVQLLLADQSSLSIAPGSDVVINEFVYDPKTQTGKLTVTVTTGLLRYVGGASSGKRDVVFYTPNAVVWLQSGIVLIEAAAAMIAELLPPSGAVDASAKRFNTLMTARFDNIVNFLKLHYCLSRRDEPFWRVRSK